MSTQGHTPGPWAVYPNPMRDDGVFIGTVEHKIEHIPRLGYVEERPRPTKMICSSQVEPADGHLIAAAPDMLTALNLAADYIKDLDGGDPTTETGWKSEELLDVWLKARAAIAKAEGRS